MNSKPSYLGLLNAIAVGELGGEAQFCAWAEVTTDDDLRPVLRTVALREAEHARSFAKRLDELGYGVLDRPDPGLPARLAIAGSTELTDLEKLERLGFASGGGGERSDTFSRFFDDTTIDPDTGALMGRYVSEERDTGRRLRACHAEIVARTPAATSTVAPAAMATSTVAPSAVTPATVAAPAVADPELCARIERLECAVTALVEALAADRTGTTATADADRQKVKKQNKKK